MKKRLSKLVWAGLPEGPCNLSCSYCYLGGNKLKKINLQYSVEHMLRCFNPARFGGPILFAAAGAGETLLWGGIINFTKGMLEYGHVVSYTTNMTIKPVLEQFCNLDSRLRSRLELDASLHYLELKKKNLLGKYFENLRMLRSAGISINMYVCISNDYIPHLREISNMCKKEIGFLPIAGMIREYDDDGGKTSKVYSPEVDQLVKETCDARQWELQKRFYGHKRTEFCHAGEFSINLNMGTGDYTKCWRSSGLKNWQTSLVNNERKLLEKVPLVGRGAKMLFREPNQIAGNLFKDPTVPITFKPIGKCPFYDCVCASYQVWGYIPELDVETHSKTFFTKDSVSKEIWDFMDLKMS